MSKFTEWLVENEYLKKTPYDYGEASESLLSEIKNKIIELKL